VKDKCLGLLYLGNAVYPRLVRLFYANLETKATANGVFFESVVKSVKITLSHLVLESIFGLKFVDIAPLNLSQKVAKDLCLQQFSSPQKLETYTQQNKAPLIMFCTPNLDCCTLFSFVFSIPKPTPKKLIMRLFWKPYTSS